MNFNENRLENKNTIMFVVSRYYLREWRLERVLWGWLWMDGGKSAQI